VLPFAVSSPQVGMRRSTGTRPAPATRILRVFSRLNIGGPSIHVVLLTAGLVHRGYDTRLVVGQETSAEGDLRDFALAHGVEPLTLPHLGRAIRPWLDVQALVSVTRLIRRYRPTIVHTHTAKAGFVGRLAAVLMRVPVVVHTYHGHVLSRYFGRREEALYRFLERLLARTSDCLVAVSEAVKAELVRQQVAPPDVIRVVPLGLELASFAGELPRGRLREAAHVPGDVPLVGIVGRLVPIKDVPTFLEAAQIVSQQSPKVRFAVVGDGEERAVLETRCRGLGLEERVYFHGWQRDMTSVHGDLDVVVNASLNEGTPVALIEALAAGRPVVATEVGGTPDLLAGGAHGRLVPAGNAPALAAAILETLATPDESLRRAREGRRHVLARHSVERLIDDMDRLYRDLLARPGLVVGQGAPRAA
jgi:glycosyltransferase involved in cell wall biosynthesis